MDFSHSVTVDRLLSDILARFGEGMAPYRPRDTMARHGSHFAKAVAHRSLPCMELFSAAMASLMERMQAPEVKALLKADVVAQLSSPSAETNDSVLGSQGHRAANLTARLPTYAHCCRCTVHRLVADGRERKQPLHP